MCVSEVFARRGSGGAEACEHLGQMTIRIYRNRPIKPWGLAQGLGQTVGRPGLIQREGNGYA